MLGLRPELPHAGDAERGHKAGLEGRHAHNL